MLKNEELKVKIIKITNELVRLFFSLDILSLQIDIQHEDLNVTIILDGTIKNLSQVKLDKIRTILNEPRQEELDEYYWYLAGDNEHPSLNLFGTLIDNADVEYKDDKLRVIIYSKL